jgi:hypothetical protein
MASEPVAALCSPSSPARRRFKPVQDAAAREKLRRTDAWWTTFLFVAILAGAAVLFTGIDPGMVTLVV